MIVLSVILLCKHIYFDILNDPIRTIVYPCIKMLEKFNPTCKRCKNFEYYNFV